MNEKMGGGDTKKSNYSGDTRPPEIPSSESNSPMADDQIRID